MRIVDGNHVYEGDEPKGREGVALFRMASKVLHDVGVLRVTKDTPNQMWNPADQALAISGHPESEALLLATFRGWTLDGKPINADLLYSEEMSSPERIFEPWLALTEAWMRLGFFGPGFLRALQAADERLKEEETPISE